MQQLQIPAAQHPQAAAQHLQLHQLVVDDDLIQQLQLHHSASLHRSHHHKAVDAVSEEVVRRRPAKLVIGVHFPHIPRAELELLGHSSSSSNFNPAAAAAADWQQALADLVAADGRCEYHLQLCEPELVARGPWELDVAVCPQVGDGTAAVCHVGRDCA